MIIFRKILFFIFFIFLSFGLKADDITLSHTAGFYDTPFFLEINGTADQTIYYTLDGSEPDENSMVYTVPLWMDNRAGDPNVYSVIQCNETPYEPVGEVYKINIVRARAFENGAAVSSIVTASFIVDENGYPYHLPMVSLVSDPVNFFSDSIGIYVPGDTYTGVASSGNYNQYGGDWERPIHMSFFDENGVLEFEQDAGIRLHGGVIRRHRQKSFECYAREMYGASSFDYPLLKDRNIEQYKSIVLRKGASNNETLLADDVTSKLLENTGVGRQASQEILVFLDGEFWGIYFLKENLEDVSYFEGNYGAHADSIDVLCSSASPCFSGTGEAYAELIDYLENNDITNEEVAQYVAEQINIEGFFKYLITEFYIANFDWPNNNMIFWKEYNDESKWQWVFFDGDYGYKYLTRNSVVNYFESLASNTTEFSTFLGRKLVENTDFKDLFIGLFEEMLNTTFTKENVSNTTYLMKSRIAPHIQEHLNRFDMGYSQTDWENYLSSVYSYAAQRPCILAEQVLTQFGETIDIPDCSLYIPQAELLCDSSSVSLDSNSAIVINEFVASNADGIADEYFNENSDWLELHNKGNVCYDLSNAYLSDNLNNPFKWKIPDGTKIVAGGFLVFWADGEDTLLHTNFKLTKAGEAIGLFNQDGEIIDSISYQAQKTDVSQGRANSNVNEWYFYETPTPNAPNEGVFYENITYSKPLFSEVGALYNESVLLELSNDIGNVYYTLDGSEPDETSFLYTNSPIFIENTTVVRARIIEENSILGPIVTHSYFIDEDFENRALPVVSIVTDSLYFWGEEQGIYVQEFKPEWEYPINLELFENDGGKQAAFNVQAGVKINGANSWVLPQKMLGIYFRREYGEKSLEYPLFEQTERTKYDALSLRCGGSDWGHGMIRDGLGQELAAQSSDLDIQGFKQCVLYVNGEYLGIHNLRSKVNEEFVEDTYDLEPGTFDLMRSYGQIENEDDGGNTEAYEYLYNNLLDQDLSLTENFNAVEAEMDLENFADYIIAEMTIRNISWTHNIKFWKPHEGGKWEWLLLDLDRGYSGNTGYGLEFFAKFNNTAEDWTASNWPGKFLNKLWDNETFRHYFIQRYVTQLYTTYHPQNMMEQLEEFKGNVEYEMPRHIERWLGTTSSYGSAMPSLEYWQDDMYKLGFFSNRRSVNLLYDLFDYTGYNEIVNLNVFNYPNNGGDIIMNDINIPKSVWGGNYVKNLPLTLKAENKIGYTFVGWETPSIFTLISTGQEWKYYDQGEITNDSWKEINFNDDTWSAGASPLGYNNPDLNTIVSYGNNPDEKHLTTYFRKNFNLNNLSQVKDQALELKIRRDDGVVVYLNGEEIVRSNIQYLDSIEYEVLSNYETFMSDETNWYRFALSTELLKEGENVLAIELHVSDSTEVDMLLDLELNVLLSAGENILSESIEYTPITTNDLNIVARYEPTGECILPTVFDKDTTLTIDCSPYVVQENTTIVEGVNVKIEAGVEIRMASEASWYIYGTLQAEGSETQPIKFTAHPDIEDAWGALCFIGNEATSDLSHIVIEGASQGEHPIRDKAAISAYYANLELDNLIIEDVESNPIFAQYSSVILSNSQIHSKVTGDLINVKYGYGSVSNCIFKGNDQPDTDAIDYDDVIGGLIQNNQIFDFFGYNSDGIDLGEESKNILIENNLIYNCSDKAISVGQRSTALVENNTILNCDQGIALKDKCWVDINKNTFYNNNTAIACFEKNIGDGGGKGRLKNSILSNSTDDPLWIDNQSELDIEYILTDTDTLSGEGVIWANPLFVNPTLNDFHLQGNSMGINAGSPESPLDTDGTITDLGSNFYDFEAPANITISAIHYHPADSLESEYLALYNPNNYAVDISNYEFIEGVSFVFPEGTMMMPQEEIFIVENTTQFNIETNQQVYQWTSGVLDNGGEQIVLANAFGVVQDHVRYDDEGLWDSAADGGGYALLLKSDDLDNHFPESWELGLQPTLNIENITTNFLIFPNPSTEYIRVETFSKEEKTIAIYNTLGQKIHQSLSNNSLLKINVKDYPKGNYILYINQQKIGKFIKQ